MFFQGGHIFILDLLLHLLPVGMTLLTWKLPWKKAQDRILFAQIVGSIVYIVVFPVFFTGSFHILDIFDIWSGEGWICVIPVITAGFVSFLFNLFQQKRKNRD